MAAVSLAAGTCHAAGQDAAAAWTAAPPLPALGESPSAAGAWPAYSGHGRRASSGRVGFFHSI